MERKTRDSRSRKNTANPSHVPRRTRPKTLVPVWSGVVTPSPQNQQPRVRVGACRRFHRRRLDGRRMGNRENRDQQGRDDRKNARFVSHAEKSIRTILPSQPSSRAEYRWCRSTRRQRGASAGRRAPTFLRPICFPSRRCDACRASGSSFRPSRRLCSTPSRGRLPFLRTRRCALRSPRGRTRNRDSWKRPWPSP